MREITRLVPDAELLLLMEPEVLGAKLLFVLRSRDQGKQGFLLTNLIGELWHRTNLPNEQSPYPEHLRAEVNLALAEAWAWLVAQGLLVAAPYSNIDWKVLSRRALKFEDEDQVVTFSISRLLSKERLNTRIANTVWGAFMRGEFDVAVFQAMKAVEVAVHEALGKPENLRGIDLMRKAFQETDGRLTDFSAEVGERQARSHLFAGTIGSFKNPQSHRNVQLSDPTEAIELILLANHLLRIVEARSSSS